MSSLPKPMALGECAKVQCEIIGRKEVSHLNTYTVRLSIPAIYPVEAENEEEAKRKAVELYKKDHDTWIEPEVHDVQKSIIQ